MSVTVIAFKYALLVSQWSYEHFKNYPIQLYLNNTINLRHNTAQYIVLYPQDGDRIAIIDSVTSLYLMYRPIGLLCVSETTRLHASAYQQNCQYRSDVDIVVVAGVLRQPATKHQNNNKLTVSATHHSLTERSNEQCVGPRTKRTKRTLTAFAPCVAPVTLPR